MAATGLPLHRGQLSATRTSSVFARRAADGWLLAVAVVHAVSVAAILISNPRGIAAVVLAAVFVGASTVYVSNTVSHWHLHGPIFRARAASRALSFFLSLSLLIPQTAWKQRHLWHHAGEPAKRRVFHMTRMLAIELAGLVVMVAVLAAMRPHALVTIVSPGWALGMLLCHLQGRFEHEGDPNVASSGVSTYSALYNRLWFNDGFHAEHHRRPNAHWTELPRQRSAPPLVSDHAPLLRVVPRVPSVATMLCMLERLVPRSRLLEHWIIGVHARAFSALLGKARGIRTILVVGGGLFPRTVLILQKLMPSARVVVVDASSDSLRAARHALAERNVPAPPMVCARFHPEMHAGFDLVIFPLAFVGDAGLIDRARATNRHVMTHEWILRDRNERHNERHNEPHARANISLLLLKRLVLSS